jgi:triacylglycerol lipase
MTFARRTKKMTLAMLLCVAVLAAAAGCTTDAENEGGAGGGAGGADAARDAGGHTDASPGDASTDDAGTADTGEVEDAAPDAGTPDDAGTDAGTDAGIDAGMHDAGPADASLPDPVLFVHGVNGSASNWDTMIGRLVADGWPADRLFAHTFADPKLGCNVDNAATIKGWVGDIFVQTGAARIDLVAHSMGSISSRYYMKNLGGAAVVNTYATLGGMHHGLWSPCLSPKGMQCTWDELCGTREFLTQLNQPPVTPGPAIWVSMYGTADRDVPNSSSELDGAENIAFEGVEHDGANGLQEVEAVYLEVRRVLEY